MAGSTDLEELAEVCLATARVIKNHLSSNGLPQMSFDQNGPLAFPSSSPEISAARDQLLTAAKDLIDLVSGPADVVIWNLFSSIQDANSMRYIYNYKIAALVPLSDKISYADLAQKAGVNLGQLKQMLHQAMTTRVFHEPKVGYVAHTAASRMLLVEGISHWNGYIVEECLPIASAQIEALQKWGHGSQEPNQAALNYCYSTDLQMFPFFESEPRRGERFSKVLQASAKQDLHHSRHAAAAYDWAALGAAKLVDVGGNAGHTSLAIAQIAPQLHVVVQDLPKTIDHAADPAHCIIPENLRHRITFMPHNFYDPQPITADVYFLRLIMHDYPDKYCLKILRAIVPKMKPGSRLVVMDQVMPPVGSLPRPAERSMRTVDLAMMMFSNAKERELEEWVALFMEADPRLALKSVVTPQGSALSLLEVVLEPTENND